MNPSIVKEVMDETPKTRIALSFYESGIKVDLMAKGKHYAEVIPNEEAPTEEEQEWAIRKAIEHGQKDIDILLRLQGEEI